MTPEQMAIEIADETAVLDIESICRRVKHPESEHGTDQWWDTSDVDPIIDEKYVQRAMWAAAPQPEEQKPQVWFRDSKQQAILNLSEAARSLGVAQVKDDQDAIDYWGAEVMRFEREARQPMPDVSALVEALDAAARSLETIGRQAGIDEYMCEFGEVRGYAKNRATVAREALDNYREQEISHDNQ